MIALKTMLSIALLTTAALAMTTPATASDNPMSISPQVTVSGVVVHAPNLSATPCSDTDFGAVQIRIGLHATLAACYRQVEFNGHFGTAFVTVPREFENRILSTAEFDSFRAEVRESEDMFKRRARDNTPAAKSAVQQPGVTQPIPLGVFDNSDGRIGYAYAYAVTELDKEGQLLPQTMMRTESFVLVNGRVILLMLITPVNDGQGASQTFDLSEKWAKSIVAASTVRTPVTTSKLN